MEDTERCTLDLEKATWDLETTKLSAYDNHDELNPEGIAETLINITI